MNAEAACARLPVWLQHCASGVEEKHCASQVEARWSDHCSDAVTAAFRWTGWVRLKRQAG